MRKVRISPKGDTLTGYENIGTTSAISYKDALIDYGELDELLLDNLIDYIPSKDLPAFIVESVKVLKKGGKLIVTGTDALEVAKALYSRNIDVNEFNNIMYGDNKKACLSVYLVSKFLKEHCGTNVIKKRLNGFEYAVEAER